MHTWFLAAITATKLIVICMIAFWAITIVSVLGTLALLKRAHKANS